MGYQTDFDGEWTITPPLTPAQAEYLEAFSEKRHDALVPAAAKLPDPLRKAVKLPFGPDGVYCVAKGIVKGWEAPYEAKKPGTNYALGPTQAPGYWCNWHPAKDGTLLEWNQGEKFYDYIEWIQFLIKHFFEPWGRKLNGTVSWYGEDREDAGRIIITNNKIRLEYGQLIYTTAQPYP